MILYEYVCRSCDESTWWEEKDIHPLCCNCGMNDTMKTKEVYVVKE